MRHHGGHQRAASGFVRQVGLAVVTNNAAWAKLQSTHRQVGFTAGPDDIYAVLRGMRTIHIRLARHFESGVKLAQAIQTEPDVERVLHPALPTDPGHALWKRDFTGASGLFGVMLKAHVPPTAMHHLIDSLKLFGLGASWGGFESLVMPTDVAAIRTATQWKPTGPVFRVHAGLEAVDDLIADMKQAFAHMRGLL